MAKMAKMDKKEILSLLKMHNQELADKFGIVSIGLFGSYARNSAHEDSDIDIAVEFDPARKNLGNFLGCKRFLEQLTP